MNTQVDAETSKQTHCGQIAIIGRPNVGKSTLMNRVLAKKISITSRRAQTTQNNVLGVKTVDETQFIYCDTPGWHNRRDTHVRAPRAPLLGMDAGLFVLAANNYVDADRAILSILKQDTTIPVIAVINKIDLLSQRDDVLPLMARLRDDYPFSDYFPICALRVGNNTALHDLENCIRDYLPHAPHRFSPDCETDASERVRAAELIREKIMRQMGDELPYACHVLIERWERIEKGWNIHACIRVERPSHKKMLIGKDGARIKKIGIAARMDMLKLLNDPVHLRLWVQLKSPS